MMSTWLSAFFFQLRGWFRVVKWHLTNPGNNLTSFLLLLLFLAPGMFSAVGVVSEETGATLRRKFLKNSVLRGGGIDVTLVRMGWAVREDSSAMQWVWLSRVEQTIFQELTFLYLVCLCPPPRLRMACCLFLKRVFPACCLFCELFANLTFVFPSSEINGCMYLLSCHVTPYNTIVHVGALLVYSYI